jgi:hypothetical protein
MPVDHTPAKELLEAAAKAVSEAGVPEPLQAVALAKAFDYLAGGAPAPLAPSAPSGEAEGKQAKETAKRARRRAAGRPQKDPDLEVKLTREVRQQLQEYRDARSAAFDDKVPNAVAIIAWFLRDQLDVDRVDEDDLYTAYAVMGWPIPNIGSALRNA